MQAEPEYPNEKSLITPGDLTSTADYKNLLQFLELGRTQLGFYEQCVNYFNERYPTALSLEERANRFYADTGMDFRALGVKGRLKTLRWINDKVRNIKELCMDKSVVFKNRIELSQVAVDTFKTSDVMSLINLINLMDSAPAWVGIVDTQLQDVENSIMLSNKLHPEDPYPLERSYFYSLIQEDSFDYAVTFAALQSVNNLLRLDEPDSKPPVHQPTPALQATLEDYVQHWVNEGIIQVRSDEGTQEGSDISDSKEKGKENEEPNAGRRGKRRPRTRGKSVTPTSIVEVEDPARSEALNSAHSAFESDFGGGTSRNLKKEYKDVTPKSKRKRRGKSDVTFATRTHSKISNSEVAEEPALVIFMRKQDRVIFDRLADRNYPVKVHPNDYANLIRSLVENNPHYFEDCRLVRSNIQMTFFFKLTQPRLGRNKNPSYAVHLIHGKDGDKVPFKRRLEYFGIFEVLGIDQAEIRLKAEEK
jgi:hypothetical protein